jgi:hypothetical protein
MSLYVCSEVEETLDLSCNSGVLSLDQSRSTSILYGENTFQAWRRSSSMEQLKICWGYLQTWRIPEVNLRRVTLVGLQVNNPSDVTSMLDTFAGLQEMDVNYPRSLVGDWPEVIRAASKSMDSNKP